MCIDLRKILQKQILLAKKIKTLEALLDEKTQEIEALRSDKSSIGSQLEELLDELETIEI